MTTEQSARDLAYRMGRDAALNGANTKNCHFTLFATPEMTAGWERGNRDAKEKEKK